MQVRQIWRFPVKSIGGERLESTAVDHRGIEFDRAWGVHDPATDKMLTARREPSLLFLTATVANDRPCITTPDGQNVSADEDLSRWIGRPVEVRAAADGPGTFENPMNIDDETDWVEWQSAGPSFHDGRSTISFVSTGTLAEWDVRRFRINLVVDGHGEDDLAGTMLLGTSTLSIRKPIERCVMVSRPQPGLARDLDVLKAIIRHRDNKLGVGATVSSSGTISVGDELVPA